jgi:hypothetical protein
MPKRYEDQDRQRMDDVVPNVNNTHIERMLIAAGRVEFLSDEVPQLLSNSSITRKSELPIPLCTRR